MAHLWCLLSCFITWWFVTYSVHKTQDTHTHTQDAPKEAALIDLFQIHHYFQSSIFFSSLPNPSLSAPLSWFVSFPHTPEPLFNYPGMPHITLQSSHWRPSWLHFFLSTQIKQTAAAQEKLQEDICYILKWIWRKKVCFTGDGSFPLSSQPCGSFSEPIWQSWGRMRSAGSTGSPWRSQRQQSRYCQGRFHPADVSHRQTTSLELEF